jgi:hypothetical protein
MGMKAFLVFCWGQLLPARVEDQEFGVAVDAVTLTRKVEMYQWHEKQDRREYKVYSCVLIETSHTSWLLLSARTGIYRHALSLKQASCTTSCWSVINF